MFRYPLIALYGSFAMLESLRASVVMTAGWFVHAGLCWLAVVVLVGWTRRKRT